MRGEGWGGEGWRVRGEGWWVEIKQDDFTR